MNKSILVSIIVPVYNVEKYLNSCINSILGQTYQNIEVILVNDGSKDNSKKICLEIVKMDSRVSYYEKENSGLSDTRNVGLNYVKGDYVMFVDSDDLLAPFAVEELVKICNEGNYSVVSSEIVHFIDGKDPNYKNHQFIREFDKESAICSFLYQKEISTSACGKIYSSKLFENVRFKSGILFEDNLFLSDVFNLVDRITYCDGGYYGYRHRNNSITTSHFSAKDLDILSIGEEMIRRYENTNKNLCLAVHTYQLTNCLRIYLTLDDKDNFSSELNYCIHYIKKFRKEVLANPSTRNKLKIGLLLVSFPRPLVMFIRNHIERWKD